MAHAQPIRSPSAPVRLAEATALVRGPGLFPAGLTPIRPSADLPFAVGVDFAILRLKAGDRFEDTTPHETVWVLLNGTARLACGSIAANIARRSLFDEPPTALHVPADSLVTLEGAVDGAEFAVARTENARSFSPLVFEPRHIGSEARGADLVQNTALRNVRLIFDRTNRPDSDLVVGEVVNYPGRWSSYPPHHHAQPEIYHYRFTAPQGYGHAELGDDVVKVRTGDTVFIPPGLDHAQVSAPGYGMYYLWIIRHLPGDPYTGFTFASEHRWTLDPAQPGWQPAGIPALPA